MKRQIIAASPLILLLACGGSGSSSSTSTPVPSATIGGVWTGTVHSNSTGLDYVANALVLPDGTFRYLASNWAQVVGSAAVSGKALSASATLYYNGTSGALSLSGSANSNSAMTGSFSGADAGTFTFSYAASANTAIQLSALAGSYQSSASQNSSGLDTSLTISSTGVLSGSNGGGSFTGTATQVSPGLNAFNVSKTYTPTGGSSGSTFTGTGFYSPAVGTTPALVQVQVTSGTSSFGGLFSYVGP